MRMAEEPDTIPAPPPASVEPHEEMRRELTRLREANRAMKAQLEFLRDLLDGYCGPRSI